MEPMTINLLPKKETRRKIHKAIQVFTVLAVILNMTSASFAFTPWAQAATDDPAATTDAVAALETATAPASDPATQAVCPDGNVKVEIGQGYAYTDHTATVTGNGRRVEWEPADGYVVTQVCVKIGGPGGGTLISLDPEAGAYETPSYDISHVVVWTERRETPPTGSLRNLFEDTQPCTEEGGLRVVAKGVGLLNAETGTINDFAIPGTVARAYLVWSGHDRDAMNGDPDPNVTLRRDGGPANPVVGAPTEDGAEAIAFSADVTSLVASGTHDYTIAGVDGFDRKRDGAGLIVAYRDPSAGPAHLELWGGLDFAYWGNPFPEGTKTAVYAATFDPVSFSRTATVTLLAGGSDVQNPNRPDNVWFRSSAGAAPANLVDQPGATEIITNAMQGNNGAEWDTIQVTVTIPANATYAAFQWESPEAGNGESLSWAAMGFSVEEKCGCDLSIRKSVEEERAAPGDILHYRLNFVNNGNANCTGGGVKIEDTLDAHLTFTGTHDEDTDDHDIDFIEPEGQILRWNAHVVSPGETGWVTFEARVNGMEPCTVQDIPNHGRIWSQEGGWVQSNVVHTDSVAPCPGSLLIKKFNDLNANRTWDEGEPFLPGWNFKVAGPGEMGGETDARGMLLFEDLGPGTYTVTESLQPGWINTTDLEQQAVVEPNGETVLWFGNRQLAPDLAVTKTDGRETATPGQEITYLIEVTNIGEQGAGGVTATDALPPQATYVRSTVNGVEATPTVTPDPNGDSIVWNLGLIAPTEATPRLIAITVRLDASFPAGATNLVNRVEVATTTHEPNLKNNVATDETLVHAAPILAIEKTDTPDPVEPGALLTYTIGWSVSGTAAATNVILSDPIPTQTTFDSCTGGCTLNGNVATWNLGTHTPGDAGSVQLIVRVAQPLADGTELLNTATIDSDETEPVTDTASTTVVGAPIIAVVKSDAPDPVQAGGTLTYTIGWSVAGNTPVTNLTVVDQLPTANVTFVSASGAGVFNPATKRVTWVLGNHAPGESGSLTITVTVASPLANGTLLTNVATIDSDENEPVSDTETTTVASAPILRVNKTDDITATVRPDGTITYTIVWSVLGNSPATNVVMTDPIPANVSFVSSSVGSTYNPTTKTVTWALGSHTPGDTGSVSLTVRVATPLADGTILTNVVTLDSDETTPVNDDETTEVDAAPILAITKTVNTSFTNPGASITYTVTITNTGTDAARNLKLTDTLPVGFLFTETQSNARAFQLGTLTPGSSATVVYDVTVDNATREGTYENRAIASADNHGSLEAKVPVEIRIPSVLGTATAAALTVEKSAEVTFTNPGATVLYTVTVRNVGTEIAKNVTIVDTLPEGFTFVDGGGRSKTRSIGDLAPNHLRTITYEVRVALDVLPGTYKNVVIAQAENVPPVSDELGLEVRQGTVLAQSGIGIQDLLIIVLAVMLIALGFITLRPGRLTTAEKPW